MISFFPDYEDNKSFLGENIEYKNLQKRKSWEHASGVAQLWNEGSEIGWEPEK